MLGVKVEQIPDKKDMLTLKFDTKLAYAMSAQRLLVLSGRIHNAITRNAGLVLSEQDAEDLTRAINILVQHDVDKYNNMEDENDE